MLTHHDHPNPLHPARTTTFWCGPNRFLGEETLIVDVYRTYLDAPQTQPGDARQKPNHGGGYSFTVTPAQRVQRFLTLGSDSGTYYVDAPALTVENAALLVDMARDDPAGLVESIVDVSLRGAAPRVQPALFALALAASTPNPAGRAWALAALPVVARTGSHLLTFAGYVDGMRGWGRGLRSAVGGWYTCKDADALAYQVVKYAQRDGWSHRDVLRLAHPVTSDAGLRAVFDYVTRGAVSETAPDVIRGVERAHSMGAGVASLVHGYGLSWEMLPSQALTDPAVWEALLASGMGQTALMRNLPRLTRLGLLPSQGGWTDRVCAMLTDPGRLRRGRVHPMNVLVAARTYGSGQSVRGSTTWTPTRKVVDALDAAFYAAYPDPQEGAARTLVGLDVSGSMTAGIAGLPLSAREAAAALALVLVAQTDADVVAFTSSRSGGSWWKPAGADGVTPLPLSTRQRVDDVTRKVAGMPFGATDCAAPMLWASREGRDYDHFVILTDSETNSSSVHPHTALARYRDERVPDARLSVVAMTATDVSVADPTDAGMMDVAGFDTAVPNLLVAFGDGAL